MYRHLRIVFITASIAQLHCLEAIVYTTECKVRSDGTGPFPSLHPGTAHGLAGAVSLRPCQNYDLAAEEKILARQRDRELTTK